MLEGIKLINKRTKEPRVIGSFVYKGN